jgi:hypothetical protein
MFLNGRGVDAVGPRGEPLEDDHFYFAFNAHHEPMTFKIPDDLKGSWTVVFDSKEPTPAVVKPAPAIAAVLPGGETETVSESQGDSGLCEGGEFQVEARSLVLLRAEVSSEG